MLAEFAFGVQELRAIGQVCGIQDLISSEGVIPGRLFGAEHLIPQLRNEVQCALEL